MVGDGGLGQSEGCGEVADAGLAASPAAATMETSRSRVGSARAFSSRAMSLAWLAVIGSRSSGAQHTSAGVGLAGWISRAGGVLI